MSSDDNKLSIHVNVKISADALQAIVGNAKKAAVRDADGVYRVDTADQVSAVITRFLDEKDFESFAQNPDNYVDLPE